MSSTRASAKLPFFHLSRDRERLVFLACAFALTLAAWDPASLQAASPGTTTVPAGSIEAPAVGVEGIDRLVADALAEGKLPGCVVVVGRKSGIVYSKAFGFRALLPEREPMTEDTLFDLASLTKPIATSTSLMILADQGKLDLDDRASRYLPEFAAHGKDSITLRQLLTHVSGLPAETPIDDYQHGRKEAIRRIAALSLNSLPALAEDRPANVFGSSLAIRSMHVKSTLAASYARPAMASGSFPNFTLNLARKSCRRGSGLSTAKWFE